MRAEPSAYLTRARPNLYYKVACVRLCDFQNGLRNPVGEGLRQTCAPLKVRGLVVEELPRASLEVCATGAVKTVLQLHAVRRQLLRTSNQ